MLGIVRLGVVGPTMVPDGDGQRALVFRGLNLGDSTIKTQVALPAGKSGRATFGLDKQASPGAPRVPIQSLVDTVTPVVSVPTCSG